MANAGWDLERQKLLKISKPTKRWMIDNQDTIVIVENKRMDYVLYQINKEKQVLQYIWKMMKVKINFKFVGSSLVQE